jgi:nucleoside-diphosphate kinase
VEVEIRSERTFVLLKPDAFSRRLVPELLERLTRGGADIVACKMLMASKERLEGHFPTSASWAINVGRKTERACMEARLDPVTYFGSTDYRVIGKTVRQWGFDYLMSGPVMPMVLTGADVIARTRAILGPTMPNLAPAGTIRGDLGDDTGPLATIEQRAVYNLVHASEDAGDAARETANWFAEDEIIN